MNFRKFYKKKYGFKTKTKYEYLIKGEPSEKLVKEISKIKNEESFVTQFRLNGLKAFLSKPLPTWGPSLKEIDFNITYYAKPLTETVQSWESLPKEIKKTYEKLKIPELERKYLGGLEAQFDSEIILKRVKEELKKQGIIFTDPDDGLKNYPIFKKWIGKVVPPNDNKFAALNTAFFSGGSFIYVPPNTKVPYPLQTYFRINAENVGQFERTLIIVDSGSELTYIEGCTAPIYSKSSLHAAVVEIVAMPNSKVRYITLQNWSNNVYNLVTKRAFAYENARVEWIDANIGSKITMKYPSVFLLGKNSSAEFLSIAYAGNGQIQDTGAKAIHVSEKTRSNIIAKSVSQNGGEATYRGLIKITKNAINSKAFAKCNSLLLDEISKANTYPYSYIENELSLFTHEAFVGKIDEDKLFYLMSRGLEENEALSLLVTGFFNDFIKQIPLEYSIEFQRLIELQIASGIC
ncbi:MAG: Fe-S cluster assembly protein SufB [Candidatus Aenigmatarchaeota archaeon]